MQLPTGLQAQLSPWNAIGEVFRYRVVGKGYSLKDLKTAEDWVLERQFKQVPGVIDVTSYGGETKQYHVQVDPYRLRGAGRDARPGHGGDPEREPERGRPASRSWASRLRRSRHRSARLPDGGAARHREHRRRPRRRARPSASATSADVDIGFAPRLGIVGYDDDPDVVQGIVLMRYGGETPPTLEGIHAKVDYIRQEPHPAARAWTSSPTTTAGRS